MSYKTIIYIIILAILISGCSKSAIDISSKVFGDEEDTDIKLTDMSDTTESNIKDSKESGLDLLTSIDKEIGGNANLRFIVLGDKKEETVNRIIIMDIDKDIKIQEIKVEFSVGHFFDGSYGVRLLDYNFDGDIDLSIQLKGGSGANTCFSIWLCNKGEFKFSHNDSLSELVSPEVDYKNKVIVSSNSSSAGAYYNEYIYAYRDDELVLIKKLERTFDTELNAFIFKFYELVDDKMQFVKEVKDYIDDNIEYKFEWFWNHEIWQTVDIA